MLDGTLAVEGRTTNVGISSRPANAFSSYLGTVINNQFGSTDIIIGMIFASATASGNTIIATGVDRSASNYANPSPKFLGSKRISQSAPMH